MVKKCGSTSGMRVGEVRKLIRIVKGRARRITIRKVASVGFPQYRIMRNEAL